MSDRQQNTVVNVNLTAPVPGVATVEAKSVGVALVFWFFLGTFGGHRFYLNRPHARTMLILALAGVVLSFVVVGLFLIAAVALWALIDAFSLPKWVAESNRALASGGGGEVPTHARGADGPPDLSTLLLREAKQRGGRLTVTQGVMATGKTFDEVEDCLRGMLTSGYVDVDNDPESGAVIYVFGEME